MNLTSDEEILNVSHWEHALPSNLVIRSDSEGFMPFV